MSQDDKLWYKDAIIYEVPVRAYQDAIGSGVGNFRGLTQKLDYLEDLGITTVWLLPFYPSPLKDDGYDIADYMDVHPIYGTLSDFKTFLEEAHRRGLKVITELVINHTSDQHPWFQRARLSPPGSNERNFYVWSDTTDKFSNVPLMFPDFENSNWTWDPVAKQYYWHRFYSHQPDLNFDNPEVWKALFPIVDFWMEMGVDGMRLDAVPYLFEREGTLCEHLPETHGFLKALRAHVDAKFPNRMFLAEANAWPEDAVSYFGEDDECHMAFHFPLMPRLFMALQQEDRFPILDIFAQTPNIPANCQWCLFLRNHDELTLAMVTDEERDYMFRAYARDSQAKIFLGIRHRLAPLLRNDRRRIELMNALLFSMPGTPVIYYGDEIGMGDNIYLGDRNGVRTPMQWSADRNAGFSRANPQKLYSQIILDPEYHYEAVNVEAQQNNPSSLLWWTKRLIALRKKHKSLGRGSIEFLRPENSKVLAYIRQFEEETLLLVANLSRFVQQTDLDLKSFAGWVPEELYGHSRFPVIQEVPYSITLGPHGFYWFLLKKSSRASEHPESEVQVPTLEVKVDWSELFENPSFDEIEEVLQPLIEKLIPENLDGPLMSCHVATSWRMQNRGPESVYILVVRLEWREGLPESFLLPLTFTADDQPRELLIPAGQSVLAKVGGPRPGRIIDAAATPEHFWNLIHAIAENRRLSLERGFIRSLSFSEFDPNPPSTEGLPSVQRGQDGDLTAIFDSRFILRTFRDLNEGIHPDVEVGRFLTKQNYFGIVPILGTAELHRGDQGISTLAVLKSFVPNQKTAWEQAQHLLSQFFEKATALSRSKANRMSESDEVNSLEFEADRNLLFAESEAMAEALGKNLAELQVALTSDPSNPAFVPELTTSTYQRSVYQTMRSVTEQILRRFKWGKYSIPESARELVDRLQNSFPALDQRFRKAMDPKIDGYRIRCHGDYHLARLLFVGDNYILTDFVGDSSRSISERRIKKLGLRDLATLLRSMDYVLNSVIYDLGNHRGRAPGVIREEDQALVAGWAEQWRIRTTTHLIDSYLKDPRITHLLPSKPEIMHSLLNLFQVERALVELDYDLRRRPEWIIVPLNAIFRCIEEIP
ncbi:maltose alpha-D-glucosyltransferase [Telmatocola sphagniphila]|uniref:maltose alpha-D-glucosyltransferase n=1 Tax=Telmatocola sphagniphila TaxID=1123043 RepID=A0A8E6B8W6_9BACT|nr:maltose alpha-D-glucosyltransferase [Telmatocola sphagniphila]QVL33527.1 maltose alpha-D-glucosyltransferase [Telmatocola sphagniphila]